MGRQRIQAALSQSRRQVHRIPAELPPPVGGDPAFVMLVKTDNAGTSASDQMTLPLTGSYTIDWGDGVVQELSGAQTHTYPAAGEYTIRITGAPTRILFNNGGDRLKLLDIQNWGDIAWTSMASAFYGCANMTLTAQDIPVLSSLVTFASMFRAATSFDQNLGSWDVAHITNVSNMFLGVTLSPANYGGTLIGWAAQTLVSDRNFHGGTSTYPTDGTGNPATDAAAARAKIIADFGWTVVDGGPV